METRNINHVDSVFLGKKDALIVVDMQYDFMPGGALPVADGDTIIEGINEMIQLFSDRGLTVVMTQDWHPPHHHSFASAHKDKRPYDLYNAPGIGPVLWPDHCVQGTKGAELHKDMIAHLAHAIIRKGYNKEVDSYSGFLENDKKTETGLDGYLKGRSVDRIFVCGLAMDYCVFFTAADGASKGYAVYYITDLTKPVGSPENSISNAFKTMEKKGVRFIRSHDIKADKLS